MRKVEEADKWVPHQVTNNYAYSWQQLEGSCVCMCLCVCMCVLSFSRPTMFCSQPLAWECLRANLKKSLQIALHHFVLAQHTRKYSFYNKLLRLPKQFVFVFFLVLYVSDIHTHIHIFCFVLLVTCHFIFC